MAGATIRWDENIQKIWIHVSYTVGLTVKSWWSFDNNDTPVSPTNVKGTIRQDVFDIALIHDLREVNEGTSSSKAGSPETEDVNIPSGGSFHGLRGEASNCPTIDSSDQWEVYH